METVNKVYHAASHAVWGEEHDQSGEEPVSGKTGQGTATDPYDAGNMEEQEDAGGVAGQTKLQDQTGSQGKTTSSTENPVDADNTFNVPQRRVDPDAPSNATNTAAGGIVGDPASGTGSIQKQQGADKPLDLPSNDQMSSIQDRKSTTESTQNAAFGKDESVSGVDTAASTQSSKVASQRETSGGSDPESTRKDEPEATGEKYVKSSGFAAEGGDFDATKPGAGREADRLLEGHGHHEEGLDSGEGHTQSGNGDEAAHNNGHGKPKMMDKMKDKLHIGKHVKA